jgi:large subunit ribosomal protein L10
VGLVVSEGTHMQRTEKERVVAELAEQLRSTESLIVADYRGLTNAQLEELRGKLRGSGARLQVVKNTLTRRAAEEAGAEALLALLEGPTAIAFVDADGDPVAVAKALSDTAKDTKVLELRGGTLSGRAITGTDVEELAKLPAPDVIKGQLVGVIVAPLTQLAALLAAPLRDLVGLIDARIVQLEEGGDTSAASDAAEAASLEPAADETAGTTDGEPEPEVDSAAQATEVAAGATEDTPEAADGAAAPEEAVNADTGTEEE